MVNEAYLKAKALIEKHQDLADFNDGCEEDVISAISDKLGIKFSGSYYNFLIDFGVGSFGGTEIYGLINSDFENSSIPDGAWVTNDYRNSENLDENLFVIGEDGMGGLICLDLNKVKDGEPLVVTVEEGESEYLADSFGAYLLEQVTQEIGNADEPVDEPIAVPKKRGFFNRIFNKGQS